MKVSRPVPARITYRGARYYWINNYGLKREALNKVNHLKLIGRKAVVANIGGIGDTNYAVYAL